MSRRRCDASIATLVPYLRCSTREQAESGLGLEAQRRAIAQYAELYSIDLGEAVVDDGYSAKDLDRPGMQHLRELFDRRAVAGVIIAKLDRLTRSVRDVGDLVARYFDRGLRLVSVGEQVDTGSAGGRLVLNVLASVSQWEREAIGERTKAALRSKRDCGERAGALPFGHRLDPADKERQRLAAEPLEQLALRRIFELRRTGLSVRGIAEQLRREGVPARGARWWPSSVHRLLGRPPHSG